MLFNKVEGKREEEKYQQEGGRAQPPLRLLDSSFCVLMRIVCFTLHYLAVTLLSFGFILFINTGTYFLEHGLSLLLSIFLLFCVRFAIPLIARSPPSLLSLVASFHISTMNEYITVLLLFIPCYPCSWSSE